MYKVVCENFTRSPPPLLHITACKAYAGVTNQEYGQKYTRLMKPTWLYLLELTNYVRPSRGARMSLKKNLKQFRCLSVSIERAKQALSGAYSQSRILVSNADLYAV